MKNSDIDLLFLDIELAEGEDGFQIAEQLMHCGNKSKICFLTSHTEQARLGYKVNAFRYVDKKHLDEIGEALDSFLKTKIQDRIISCNSSKVITNEPKKMPPCFGCPARNARRKIQVFHRRMKSSRLPCQSYSAAPGL